MSLLLSSAIYSADLASKGFLNSYSWFCADPISTDISINFARGHSTANAPF